MIKLKLDCQTGGYDYLIFGYGCHKGEEITYAEVSEKGEESMILLSNGQLIELRDALLDAFPLDD